ncbi:MAG: hypothetical protein MZU84_03205 [Sphingobacterium sp.]|nr:hypothetical protein [Sphingobacterium sp.]
MESRDRRHHCAARDRMRQPENRQRPRRRRRARPLRTAGGDRLSDRRRARRRDGWSDARDSAHCGRADRRAPRRPGDRARRDPRRARRIQAIRSRHAAALWRRTTRQDRRGAHDLDRLLGMLHLSDVVTKLNRPGAAGPPVPARHCSYGRQTSDLRRRHRVEGDEALYRRHPSRHLRSGRL